MYRKTVNALYLLNIISQALFTLLTLPALAFLLTFLLVRFAGAPPFLYAILIPIAFIFGIFSMISFIIKAGDGFERLQKEREKKLKQKKYQNNGETNEKN